ncbi:MAG TPA: metalloregulator ArsR/SmtB family transcription factor [Candidatus Acidoferrales bacterium]|jgi:ArsR family transcriptional regulator|nr:metalloregulator ArsR/SmtB family transcription factor [Candidatus Acidoferrales bacterium]
MSIETHDLIEIVGPDGPAAAMATEEDRAYQRAAVIGRAMADPKRLCVLESLADGELSVSDLSARVRCQVPNMSQHLSVLRSAGLVTSRRDGTTVYYRLSDPRVLEAFLLLQAIAR